MNWSALFYRLVITARYWNFFDEKRENLYKVVDETPCPDSSVHYVTINSKKQRISATLLQIKDTTKLRNTSEAARELADHYIYSHKMNEPELF
jgi:hypothetical protein